MIFSPKPPRNMQKTDTRQEATIISASELRRLQASAVILSSDQEAELNRRKEEDFKNRMAKSQARKEMIMRMEEERKRTRTLTVIEKEDRTVRNAIIERAQEAIDESHDDVKHMNQLVQFGKTATIRDAQLQERRMLEEEREEIERQVAAVMEIERLKALQLYEEREQSRLESQRKGARVIVEQIMDREIERARAAEMKDRERELVLKQVDALRMEEEESIRQKKLAAQRLLEEVAEVNSASIRAKQEKKAIETLEDARITKYLEEKAAKELLRETELKAIAAEKEKEVARLRAMQEKAQDKQAEIDALRAKRAVEATERSSRQKELELKEKKFRMNTELEEARIMQQAEKERRLIEIAQAERDEFERIIHTQQIQEEAELARRADERRIRYNHCNDVKTQIAAKEELKLQTRRNFLEEGGQTRASLNRERKMLEAVKLRKLEEMERMGIPEKYRSDLLKKKISV